MEADVVVAVAEPRAAERPRLLAAHPQLVVAVAEHKAVVVVAADVVAVAQQLSRPTLARCLLTVCPSRSAL